MFEEQESLPALIYLNRKKKQTFTIQSTDEKTKPKGQQKQSGKSQQEENKKQGNRQVRENLAERMAAPRVEQFDARFKAMNEKTKDQREKPKAEKTDKYKELENSKSLINQILYKINGKNMSEQLYPVTNETIQQLKKSLDEEIDELKIEAERKENSLHSNPNNQHLKKQLQSLKKSIDRSMTIKQLYNEKINLRNKINILETSIINLKQENMNLKIKISRGVQTIQNHMHNLPCEQEKQLKLELNKCMKDYKKQKDMREKLQGNISQIVLNFKRLYQEAQTARLIVTRKLTELQAKEKQLLIAAKEAEEKAEANKEKQQKNQLDPNSLKVASIQARMRKQTIQEARNNAMAGQLNKKTPQKKPIVPSGAPTERTKHRANQSQSQFSLQEQIKRMRANQSTIVTLQRR